MRVTQRFTEEELENKIIQLKDLYSPIDLNPTFHNNKIQCAKKLNAILDRVNRQDLQKANTKEIVLCALTLIYYFSMRFKLSSSTSKHFSRWYSKRQFLKAETVFQKTMDKLLPECSEATTTIMLTFFTDVALWPFEKFIAQIFEIVLYFTRQTILVLNMILTDVQCVLCHDIEDARHRIRVIYELLKSEHLILETPKLISFIKRLLDYYTNDIVDSNNKLVVNFYLKRGFEVCLRQVFERVANQHRIEIISTMLDWFSSLNKEYDGILELSALVQYAAELYKVGLLSKYLPENLMIRVLDSFVGSTNPSHCLVGCRLVQHFLDRQLNAQYLAEPKLYYEITDTQLKIGEYNASDGEFIRKHKEQLHKYFILAVTEHCKNSTNVKAVFTVVCCMILEVPCGLTAASAAFMMMVVQNFALHEQNIPLRCKHWMHAIVISVMSLICWVHKAPFLCRYVNQIMTRRAKEAPQLNPPLLQEYNVRNTNAWTNATLFFEDWELRYGLWKAFSVSPGIVLSTNYLLHKIKPQ
ncbi:uncharacterized protein LOC134661587 [Cydia amplana]|uniref:uncharacterized protein LOC134661587 n=1 Tax=Cydia amplana TaxID=1869771 RepID=UPI002FE5FB8A